MPRREVRWPHAPPHKLDDQHGTYFVTASTYLKRHHFRSAERMEVLHRGLLAVAAEYGWQLISWAVFSNHYHFVARTPDATHLSAMLGKLHEKTAKWVNRLDAQPGRQVWHNYRETHLTIDTSYFARLSYTHQNAVRHGLVPVANQYPWCSAAWFERVASAAHVKTAYGFKTDRLHVPDDFDPSPDW